MLIATPRTGAWTSAGIADLTACFDEELLCRTVTERAEKSKVAIEAGRIKLNDMSEGDSIF